MSKRVGNAVVRNHVKRRIREWFRAERERLEPTVDVVVIGRSAAAPMSGVEVSRQLTSAARELQMVVS